MTLKSVLEFIKAKKKIITIAVCAIVVFLFLIRSNLPKRFLKGLIKTYEVEYKQKQKELDSIQKVRERDSIDHIEALKFKDFELQEIQERLDRANYKIIKNEKELNSYRNGDFNERFSKFTRLITTKDSL